MKQLESGVFCPPSNIPIWGIQHLMRYKTLRTVPQQHGDVPSVCWRIVEISDVRVLYRECGTLDFPERRKLITKVTVKRFIHIFKYTINEDPLL